MATIVVTGAAGFIGQALVDALSASGSIDAGGRQFTVDRIVATDRSAPDRAWPDSRVTFRIGDIADPAFARALVSDDTCAVFHLAGIVSGAAEADFDGGLRVNLDATRLLLEACRAMRPGIRFVMSSSIAAYGVPLPEVIDDSTTPVPTLTYGTAKVIAEYLIDDYARKGFVDGCAIRFPGIVVRPPMPNGALSAFNSDIFREPLAGRPITAPVSPAACIWIQSIGHAVNNLLVAARLPGDAWGQHRVVTLPAVSATLAEIVAAISRVKGTDVSGLVDWQPNPAVEPMFGRWPRAGVDGRARALGFTCDDGVDAIVRDYLEGRRTRREPD